MTPASSRPSPAAAGRAWGGPCAVHLIDRRTGRAHRIGGRPPVLFTRRPAEAVADLPEGRDSTLLEARAEPLRTGGQA